MCSQTKQCICLILVFASASLVGLRAAASLVTPAGVDINTNDAWRTTTVGKSLDGDHDNVYGTDGYEAGNWAGTVLPLYLTLSYFGSNFTGNSYAQIDNPALTGAGPVANINSGDHYRNGGGTASEQDFFAINLTADKTFRLGIITDVLGGGFSGENPDGLRVRQTVGGAADSGLVLAGSAGADHDGDIDYYFFDITGSAGDVFVVSGRNDLAYVDNGIGGLTFDSITIPETSAFLFCAAALLPVGMIVCLRHRWIPLRGRRSS